MKYKFEQGEIVRFEDERFGVGKGGIVLKLMYIWFIQRLNMIMTTILLCAYR